MATNILKEMISYFQDDVKRINHAIKVFGFAHMISTQEGAVEKQKLVIDLTAALHDIGIKEAERKYSSTAGKYQEMEGPAIARQILEKNEIDKDIIERVCFIIGNHHSYQKIDGLDFQIIVEADFLVNIYEDGMDSENIESIEKKYFKTKSGLDILKNMYLRSVN